MPTIRAEIPTVPVEREPWATTAEAICDCGQGIGTADDWDVRAVQRWARRHAGRERHRVRVWTGRQTLYHGEEL